MNEKEAFRFLSHRFHGKYSGKNKQEKRAKKLLEEEVRQIRFIFHKTSSFFFCLDDEENVKC